MARDGKNPQTSGGIGAEVRAIQIVTDALAPLNKEARERVLDYVLRALGVGTTTLPSVGESAPIAPSLSPERPPDSVRTDIRSLTQLKAPKSANEMATLVAYYLAEVAPESERKVTIGTEDLVKYFKQAGFPLPTAIKNTLPNAAGAGYLDFVARGQYKLNPVGYNLIVHRLAAAAQTGNKQPSRKKGR